MASAPRYNAAGERIGQADLNDALFGQDPRPDLVLLAVQAELSNRRQGTHDTKSRSEVRGGGRKPYRQKGTGRARQGSIRAPHYRHGGVAHGPTPRGYTNRMPQKMRRAAFLSALSSKATDGSVRLVEALEAPEISTKQFAEWLGRLEPGRKTVLVLSERNNNVYLSARNLPGVRIVVLPGLSTYQVMNADTLILTQGAVEVLEKEYAR